MQYIYKPFLNYNENEVPQPQEDVAFGLLILKREPIKSSTKSISEPLIKFKEF